MYHTLAKVVEIKVIISYLSLFYQTLSSLSRVTITVLVSPVMSFVVHWIGDEITEKIPLSHWYESLYHIGVKPSITLI